MKTLRWAAALLGILGLGLALHQPAEALEPCTALSTENLTLEVEWVQRDGADAGSLALQIPAPVLSAQVGHADQPFFRGLSEGLAGTTAPAPLEAVR